MTFCGETLKKTTNRFAASKDSHAKLYYKINCYYIILEQRLLRLFQNFSFFYLPYKGYIMIIKITFTAYFQGPKPRGPFRSQHNPEFPSVGALYSFYLPFVFHNTVRDSGRVYATNVLYLFIVMVVYVEKIHLRFKP